MKRILIIGTVLVLAIAGLIWSEIRLADIAGAVARVGWGIGLVIAARYLVMMVLASAAWFIFPRDQRPRPMQSAAIRLVRDTINTLLPAAQIGGDIAAARLTALCGIPAPMAAAGAVTDLFLQVSTQFLFALGGTVLLLQLGGDASIIRNVVSGLLIAAPALIGFYFIQRLGAGAAIVTALKRIAGGAEWAGFAATDAFYAGLARVRSRPHAIAAGAALHLGAWLLGSIEVYLVFGFLGLPISVAGAIVIESVGQAVRSAAFAVPGAIGVQEAAFVGLCAGFGIPADAAIALSLIKRIADLAVGLPGFVLWYRMEGARGEPQAPDAA